MSTEQDDLIKIKVSEKRIYYFKASDLIKLSEEIDSNGSKKFNVYFKDITSDKGHSNFRVSEDDFLKLVKGCSMSITAVQKGSFA